MTCKGLTFEECELTFLRASVKKMEKVQGIEMNKLKETKQMIKLVQQFIIEHKCILYGGTAINDILPKQSQFYDYEYQFPDYDMFSPTAMEDAKIMADMFIEHGFFDVEAKAGVHFGTYKVFVNQIPVADITQLHEELYQSMWERGILVNEMMYSPVNFLRQACYLELSRPRGDISRWEKVYSRLSLLNKHYPLKHNSCTYNSLCTPENEMCHSKASEIIKRVLCKDDVVFIGGFANSIYTQRLTKKRGRSITEYDVISDNAEKTRDVIVEALKKEGFNATVKHHEAIGELILDHYSISIKNMYLAFIFKPVACHSYNVITHEKHKIKIATIDTLFSYYLAFIFANRPYLNENKLLCLTSVLFNVQEKHRLTHRGLFQRFNTDCYGKQHTLKDIRAEKNKMFKKLKPGTKKYNEWFFKYIPKTKKNNSNPITDIKGLDESII